jgi:PKD repeat protein
MKNILLKPGLLTCMILLPFGLSAQMFTRLGSEQLTPMSDVSFGSGWLDYNHDGFIDLYLSHTNRSPYLYENQGDGSFSLITSGSLMPAGTQWSGVSWGDYDNDGLNDLFLVSMNGANVLFHNTGGGEFQNATRTARLTDNGVFLQSTWVDYNNDGWLDLFLPSVTSLNFVAGEGRPNYLYMNNGDGTFSHAASSGLMDVPGNTTCAAFADYDNDGDQDLFMTEFRKDNWFYENNGDGTFTRITSLVVTPNENLSLSCSWGDYDNDGYPDLFVGNGTVSAGQQDNYLFHNNGDKTFTRITGGEIADYRGCTWSEAWGDLDNDGDLDLYLATIYEDDLIYLNNGDGTFTTFTDYENAIYSTGVSLADYDNDGFLDVTTANASGNGNFVYHNNGNGNNWILIACEGLVSNRSAVGARVKIKATISGTPVWQYREINGNQGLRGFNDLRVHFGLGDAAIIDSLIIDWPSGGQTRQTEIAVNQLIQISEEMPDGYIQPVFQADTLLGRGTLQVRFTDNTVCDPENPVTSWSWDFDNDGIIDSDEPDPVHTFRNDTGQTYTVSLTVSNGTDTKTLTKTNLVHIYPLAATNLAFWGRATASSFESEGYSAGLTIDENPSSRWSSEYSDDQWLMIEMDSVYDINRVVIQWENAYGRSYTLQTSPDGETWTDVYNEDQSNGGIDSLKFDPTEAKFVRLNCIARATNYGFSIYEIEILRSDGRHYTYTAAGKENEVRFHSYPNPFTLSSTISYTLIEHAFVELNVYELSGRKLVTLVNEEKQAGSHSVTWSPGQSATHGTRGYYLCRLSVRNGKEHGEYNLPMIVL